MEQYTWTTLLNRDLKNNTVLIPATTYCYKDFEPHSPRGYVQALRKKLPNNIVRDILNSNKVKISQMLWINHCVGEKS